MLTATSDLSALSRQRSNTTSPSQPGLFVPRPATRWKSRVLLPLAILATTLGLGAYGARSALWPAIDVWVTPVVVKAEGGAPTTPDADTRAGGDEGTPPPITDTRPGAVLSQAPGWIEASPYPITVAALTDGVVKEVLVLEGERVEADSVVARMVDLDAKLALRRAEAELAERQAAAARARADASAAAARTEEVRDDVSRKRGLVEAGAVSAGEFSRLEHRLRAVMSESDSAIAGVAAAQAAIHTHEVLCEEARLALDRTEIRSPTSGVVMVRLVEPGTRISMNDRSGEAMAGGIVRLYEPSTLQVRVDVPLADASKIGVGTMAEIVTEALPGTTFKGAVTRIMQEANIQRNTVQVKVSIKDPVPTLKPEMLTRVRFRGTSHSPPTGAGESGHASTDEGDTLILAPASALKPVSGNKSQAWIVDQLAGSRGPVAALRDLTIIEGTIADADGYIVIISGLRAGDRLIVDAPSTLKPGARLHVLGERSNNQPTTENP